MIRYYGTNYRDMLNAQFAYFRDENNVKPSAYSSGITNVSVDSRFVTLRDNARNAALMANTHVCNIQGTGLSAINEITSFYDSVDAVSNSIYVEASLLFGTLNNVLSTINNLCVLLHSAKRGYSYVTIEAINNASEPLNVAENLSVAAALANLYNSDGSINEENIEAFRSAMAEMGISDLTDEEIALLYKIYNLLLDNNMSPEDIIAYLPIIYNSSEFEQMLNNPYVLSNADAFAQCFDGILGMISDTGNPSAYNYLLVVDNLIDENGNFNPVVLDAYRERLEELGIVNVSEDEIRGYLIIVEILRNEYGFTDEEILAYTSLIYGNDLLDQVYIVGRFDGNAQQQVIQEVLNSVLSARAAGQVDYYCDEVSRFYIEASGSTYSQTECICREEDEFTNLIQANTRKDCSGYVSYILVNAGVLPIEDLNSSSGDFLPNGDCADDMRAAGYVWHSMSEVGDDGLALQSGDIMVKSGSGSAGHIEIFAGSLEGGGISYYSWGDRGIESEPVVRSYSTVSEHYSAYSGFWRYEG